MFELLTLFMVLGLAGLGIAGLFFGVALIAHLVVSLLGGLFWLISLPFRAAFWFLLLPFKILGGLLTLIAGVVVLPFLLIAALGACGVAGFLALANGLFFVALPILLLALPVALLVCLLRRRPNQGAAS
jgi:hypothetical protein